VICDALKRINPIAYVPGTTELLNLTVRGWDCGQQFVVANVNVPGARKYVDCMTILGRTRIVGFYEPTVSSTREGTSQFLSDTLRIERPSAIIGQILADVPDGTAVLITGTFDPAPVTLVVAASNRRTVMIPSSNRDGFEMIEGVIRNNVRWGASRGIPIVANPVGRHGVLEIAKTPGHLVARASRLASAVDTRSELYRMQTTRLSAAPADQQDEGRQWPLADLWSHGFVGSARCGHCHPNEHAQWLATPHAQAMETLEAKQRQFAAECVRCHVVGFGCESGYPASEDLRSVGCEACHGPGSLHVALPSSGNIIRTPTIDLCRRCHDEEHSDFRPDSYFKRVRHR